MRIGILSSGTWGTALARLLYKNGNQVTVWSSIQDEISLLSSQHIHKNLSGIDIPKGIKFTLNLKDCCIDKDVIFFAVPSELLLRFVIYTWRSNHSKCFKGNWGWHPSDFIKSDFRWVEEHQKFENCST